jgi:hypothetical protein
MVDFHETWYEHHATINDTIFVFLNFIPSVISVLLQKVLCIYAHIPSSWVQQVHTTIKVTFP